MKLSSISFIAVALAAIAGAAVPRPLEQYSLQRDVDISSRGLPARKYTNDHRDDHAFAAGVIQKAAEESRNAAAHAYHAGEYPLEASHRADVVYLEKMQGQHNKAAQNAEKNTLLHSRMKVDCAYAWNKRRFARKTICRAKRVLAGQPLPQPSKHTSQDESRARKLASDRKEYREILFQEALVEQNPNLPGLPGPSPVVNM